MFVGSNDCLEKSFSKFKSSKNKWNLILFTDYLNL